MAHTVGKIMPRAAKNEKTVSVEPLVEVIKKTFSHCYWSSFYIFALKCCV